VPIDLDERRKQRHERVRELEARVRRVRRRQSKRARSRWWGRIRAILFVGVLVAAWVVVPRLVGTGESNDRERPERRGRAMEQIEELQEDLVEDVSDVLDVDIGASSGSFDLAGAVIDGWAAPLDTIDADRASRPHHTYAAWDYGTGVGTPVYAMTDGTIANATPDDGARCGGTVSLTTASEGARITYCHLSDVFVDRGDRVDAGEMVGLTGGAPGAPGAGRSTGAHLHLQIKLDGVLHCPQGQLVALGAGYSLRVRDLPTTGCSYQSATLSFADLSGDQSPGVADTDDPLFIWDP